MFKMNLKKGRLGLVVCATTRETLLQRQSFVKIVSQDSLHHEQNLQSSNSERLMLDRIALTSRLAQHITEHCWTPQKPKWESRTAFQPSRIQAKPKQKSAQQHQRQTSPYISDCSDAGASDKLGRERERDRPAA